MNPNLKTSSAPEVIAETTKQVESAVGFLERRVDLEGSARYCGAIVRRRVIRTAGCLMKLVMVYVLTDSSLNMVGLWGTVQGWGSLNKNAVRNRLRQSQKWMGYLIVLVLLAGRVSIPRWANKRLVLTDASGVSRPGSKKADWRLHLKFDLGAARIEDVQLTTAQEGETLTRWQFEPDEIWLADRAYGVKRGLGVVLGAMASFVIRIGWQNLPLQDREGLPFPLVTWLKVQSPDPAASPAQAQVWVETPQGRFPIRLIARAIPPEKADKNRQKLRSEAKRKKRRLDERSLLAAGFVMVVSNLPEANWSAAQIIDLYRFRWQIELVFKRLKGLLAFDHLRVTQDPQLAQLFLLTKILVALLLSEFQWRLALQDTNLFGDPDHPLSPWRLTQLLFEAFRHAMIGSLSAEAIVKHLPQLKRYLTDSPRRRRSQLANQPDLGAIYDY